jgi:hypothetical protein
VEDAVAEVVEEPDEAVVDVEADAVDVDAVDVDAVDVDAVDVEKEGRVELVEPEPEMDVVVATVVVVAEPLTASVMLGYAEYIRRAALIVKLGIRVFVVSFR